MGSEQQFCLRWHNYQSSLLATLPLLLDGDDLTDVTLCAGGRSLKAHRVVLSACSQYFKDLFKEMQPMQHPVIVLPGTEFTDLCALVTFMYSGEVNIYQHQLSSLLTMADTLHIRGLAEFTGNPSFMNNSESSRKESSSPRCKRAKVAPSPSTPACPDDLLFPAMMTPTPTPSTKPKPKNVKTKSDPEVFSYWDTFGQNMAEDLSQRVANASVSASVDEPPNASLPENTSPTIKQETVEQEANNASTTPPDNNNFTPTDLTQGNNMETRIRVQNVGGSKLYATCFVCGKQLSNQYNLRVHMETHQNAHYACSVCSHVSRSRDALRKHVSYRHPQTMGENASRATKQLHP